VGTGASPHKLTDCRKHACLMRKARPAGRARCLHLHVVAMNRRDPCALRFDDVWCDAAGLPPLHGLSFLLARGEAMVLVGSPVQGASLVFDLLLGRTRPRRGFVRVLGEDPAAEHRCMACALGTVRREEDLLERLTVMENLRYAAELLRLHCPPRYLANVLGRVELGRAAHVPVARLAPFERRRAALARALVHDPVVLALEGLLDGIQAGERVTMERVLARLVDDGKAVFVTSSLEAPAEDFAARVSLLATA
jgi:ABC-type multidrug transport system ATPase subunit